VARPAGDRPAVLLSPPAAALSAAAPAQPHHRVGGDRELERQLSDNLTRGPVDFKPSTASFRQKPKPYRDGRKDGSACQNKP